MFSPIVLPPASRAAVGRLHDAGRRRGHDEPVVVRGQRHAQAVSSRANSRASSARAHSTALRVFGAGFVLLVGFPLAPARSVTSACRHARDRRRAPIEEHHGIPNLLFLKRRSGSRYSVRIRIGAPPRFRELLVEIRQR
jgi:hypothetical protein